MKNILKKCFATTRRTIISIICIIAAVALACSVTVYAAAKTTAIGSDAAANYAFADAGVDPTAAENLKTEFSLEAGQFVYEVEFTADNSEYEYLIKASDGTVVKKSVEIVTFEGATVTATATITLDEAKKIALADAGLNADEVTFTEAKLDYDDGMSVYDVEFYTENTEYEYEINANTGAVYSKSKETLVTAANVENTADPGTENAETNTENTDAGTTDTTGSTGNGTTDTTTGITLAEAKEIALADAGVTETDVTYTKQKTDIDNGVSVYDIEFNTSTKEYEYEIRVSDGVIVYKSVETIKTTSGSNSGSSNTGSGSTGTGSNSGTTGNTGSADGGTTTGITLAEAKAIALADAGVAESDVTFTKAKTDKDDGVSIYDIEFNTSTKEYEYEIRVSDGKILDKDVETIKTFTGSGNTGSSNNTGSGNTGSSNNTGSGNTGSSNNTDSGTTGNTGSGTTDTYITVDKAKTIALNKAGLSASDVTFEKAKLEKDDGIMVYEIEFSKGRTEYECTINATTGAIIEYEVDVDD